MTYGEFRDRVRDLGFEEDATMAEDEYKTIVRNACNHALDQIAAEVFPPVRMFELPAQRGKGVKRYRLDELADGFTDFYGRPVRESGGEYGEITDYRVEGKSVLVFPPGAFSAESKVSVPCKVRPGKITVESDAETVLDIDVRCEGLLPLLASFYVWLDDDERKAFVYQNMYEDMKAAILESGREPARMVFSGGVSF